MAKIKIAICQFGLRDTMSHDEMAAHLRQQIRLAAQKGPNLVVFPELTTLGLLAMAGEGLLYAELKLAMREFIAPFTPIYEEVFTEEARRLGLFIVGGSHWIVENSQDRGYNVAHLFSPNGSIVRQRKNHLFPGETDWGTATFDGLKTYDIGSARIGLMTCYDSEFPEVGRHFMLEGAQILICPSATYTERGYYRVRRCCAARAVENQVYVVECHQAGAISVPRDKPFTSYGKSAILCPIDDQVNVTNGVLVEAPAGDQECIVTAEMDIQVLAKSREASEATILKDRRPACYKKHYRLY